MLLRHCSHCHTPFWVPDTSERLYCTQECANAMRAAKVKLASAHFDTAKARAQRTEASFQKQAASMRQVWVERKRKQTTGWFQQLPPINQEQIKEKLRSARLRQAATGQPNCKRGTIHRYGLPFDSWTEVQLYEQFLARGIYAERPALYNGWLVDFKIPAVERFIEVKSWWTVEQQGLEQVIAKMDARVFLLEEKDVRDAVTVTDFWPFVAQRSAAFSDALLKRHYGSGNQIQDTKVDAQAV